MRPTPCFVFCDGSITTLPNDLLLNTWEVWRLLLCTHPLPVFSYLCLHQCQKVSSTKSRTTFSLMQGLPETHGTDTLMCSKFKNPGTWESHPGSVWGPN